jgi:PTH1 family peptidyl-tRNA hydrolase
MRNLFCMTSLATQSLSLASCKAIIGLGNPGSRFTYTRHNIGFLFVDFLAHAYGGVWKSGPECEVATILNGEQSLLLIKPQTFMNNSGAVWSFLAKKGIRVDQLIVVHDELEKKFGTFQVRHGGSARGHNGLRSLIAACGEQFWRIRLGIDRPVDKNKVPDYVLEKFPLLEQQQLESVFSAVNQHLGL